MMPDLELEIQIEVIYVIMWKAERDQQVAGGAFEDKVTAWTKALKQ